MTPAIRSGAIQAAHQFTGQPLPLEQVTKPNLTTAELAYYSNQAEQTWRAHACKETYPEGLKPLRIGGRLNWPTAGAKKLCGVPSQTGISAPGFLACIAALTLLVIAVLMAFPEILTSLDLAGVAILGAGVIRSCDNRRSFNLTELIAAATARDCEVHLHLDDQRRPVFSVGNEDLGPTEFHRFDDAIGALHDESLDEADCAERAGAALAEGALDVIRKATRQSKSVSALEAALINLQCLPHPRRAAAGFAMAIVAFLERGLGA